MSFNYPGTPRRITPIGRLIKKRVAMAIASAATHKAAPVRRNMRFASDAEWSLNHLVRREPYSWTVLQQELEVIKQRQNSMRQGLTSQVLRGESLLSFNAAGGQAINSRELFQAMRLQRLADFEEAERITNRIDVSLLKPAQTNGTNIGTGTPAWNNMAAAEMIARMKEALQRIPAPPAPTILPPWLYDEAEAAGLLPNNCIRGDDYQQTIVTNYSNADQQTDSAIRARWLDSRREWKSYLKRLVDLDDQADKYLGGEVDGHGA